MLLQRRVVDRKSVEQERFIDNRERDYVPHE